MRGWEKIFHANGQERKAGVAILISNKIDFKTKATEILHDTIEKLDLTFSGHYIQKYQNIHSSQVLMEHSQGLITYWGTKLTSTI